ncbi:MAG: hypothetical protein ACK47B_12390 [Armatimonadota bacterium]
MLHVVLDWFEDEFAEPLAFSQRLLAQFPARSTWSWLGATPPKGAAESTPLRLELLAKAWDCLVGRQPVVVVSAAPPPTEGPLALGWEHLGERELFDGTVPLPSATENAGWLIWMSLESLQIRVWSSRADRDRLVDTLWGYVSHRLDDAWEQTQHGGAWDLANEGFGPLLLFLLESAVNEGAWKRLQRLAGPSDGASFSPWRPCLDAVLGGPVCTTYDRILSRAGAAVLQSGAQPQPPHLRIGAVHTALRDLRQWRDCPTRPEGDGLADAIYLLFCAASSAHRARPGTNAPICVRPKTPPEPLRPPSGRAVEGRLLVVDDTPAAWMPVFEWLVDSAGWEIYFCLDPEREVGLGGGRSAPLFSCLHYFDTVLADVRFPGSEARGLVSAVEIKSRRPELPVVMWTCSESTEQAARGSHASAYLFKKRLTLFREGARLFDPVGGVPVPCEPLAKRLQDFASDHRQYQQGRLLHPVFDAGVRAGPLRRLCSDVAEYAMGVLGSFHAQNDQYFRYFNSNGLEHSLRVLDHAAHLVQSLLQPPYRDGGLERSARPTPRETFLLSGEDLALLYCACFLHDLGMFPEASGRAAESTAEGRVTWAPFRIARSIVQGLLPTGDTPVVELSKSLSPLLAAACLLRSPDCALDVWFAGPANRDWLSPTLLPGARERFPDVLEAVSRLEPAARLRAGVIGALLRLADALDCDERRVPPAFLRRDPVVPEDQHLEYLRHQAVKRVEWEPGSVRLILGAVPPSTGDGSVESQDADLRAALRAYWYREGRISRASLWSLAAGSARAHLASTWNSVAPVRNLLRTWEFDRIEYHALPAGDLPVDVPGDLEIDKCSPVISLPKKERLSAVDWALFRDLFPEASGLTAEPLGGGFSGSRVYAVRQGEVHGVRLAPKVVKIDVRPSLEREVERYRRYLVPHFPAEHLIGEVGLARVRDRDALVGSLAGEGEYQTLHDVFGGYRTLKPVRSLVHAVLDQLSQRVLSVAAQPCTRSFDLDAETGRPWNWDWDLRGRISRARGHLAEENLPQADQWIARLEALSWACAPDFGEPTGDGAPIPDSPFGRLMMGEAGLVHGDLNWRNVLVGGGSWPPRFVVIDYSEAGPWLCFADYAKLEWTYKLERVPPNGDHEIYRRIKREEVWLQHEWLCPVAGLDENSPIELRLRALAARDGLRDRFAVRPDEYRTLYTGTLLYYCLAYLSYALPRPELTRPYLITCAELYIRWLQRWTGLGSQS